jgi:putative ABC transport system permease protein
MPIAEVIKISLKALKTNKSRTLLTMLGIIIGVSSVILLLALGNGLKTYITSQLESLGGNSLFVIPGKIEIGSSGSQEGGFPGAGTTVSKFTFNHLNRLEKEAKTIKNVMAYIENGATVKFKGKSRIVQVAGVGPEYPQIGDQEVQEGTFFNLAQYNAAKKVVILGRTVAEKLFGEQTPIGQKILLADQSYLVLGVLEEKGAFGGIDLDNQVYIPATTSLRQFDMEYIQSFWVEAVNSESVPETKKEIAEIMLKFLTKDDFSVMDTKSISGVINQVIGVLTAALGGIAAISLVVGGIGIMNIMLVSVTERTREIGLRKAIGATPKVIRNQFLIEALVISLGGGLIGLLLGISGSFLISRFFPATVTLGAIALAFFVSVIVGVIFGVTPAVKAARLNPIEALRHE